MFVKIAESMGLMVAIGFWGILFLMSYTVFMSYFGWNVALFIMMCFFIIKILYVYKGRNF